MPRRINVPSVAQVNFDLLDKQLKAAAPADCYGISWDADGLHIEVADAIAANVAQTLMGLVLAHDPNQDTPEQAAAKVGKTDLADWLTKADTALSDIKTKLDAFKAAPDLTNAAPLLIELAQDMRLALRAQKYIAKKINGQLP